MDSLGYLLSRIEQGRLFDQRAGLARAVSPSIARLLAASLVRPLDLPPGKTVFGIGGGTFGGSGKTPLAIACAEYVATLDRRVALVGHAYRASPRMARVVRMDDPVQLVGDEALVAAIRFQRLPPEERPVVVVAPTRQQAISFAKEHGDVLLLDGVLQTTERLDLSLLAVDSEAPWGVGAVPPWGDMRAAQAGLLSACDVVVSVGPLGSPHATAVRSSYDVAVDGRTETRPLVQAHRSAPGVLCDGVLRPLSGWMSGRIGLVTLLAHPERLLRQLRAARLVPVVVHSGRDHGSIETSALARIGKKEALDAWVCSAKCAHHLPSEVDGRPVLVVDDDVQLPPSLCARMAAVIQRRRVSAP